MFHYNNYGAKDFAEDEFFQEWVLRRTEESRIFWENWLKVNPHKQAEVEEARQMLLMLGRPEIVIPQEKVRQLKASLFERIGADAFVNPRPRHRVAWMAAASLLILMMAAGGYVFYQYNAAVEYATGYGEQREVTLPDGSYVKLNGNSSLSYKDWHGDSDREVTLKGEAYFDVNQVFRPGGDGTGQLTKFVVHTSSSLDVAVLGTVFNVNAREGHAEVVLESGKVRVDIRQGTADAQTVLMEPGDMVAFSENAREEIIRRRVEPRAYLSWKDNIMVFDGWKLSDIASRIEETYGLKMVFETSALAERRFQGSVPSQNIDVLLEAFKKLYGVEVEIEEDTILIREGEAAE